MIVLKKGYWTEFHWCLISQRALQDFDNAFHPRFRFISQPSVDVKWNKVWWSRKILPRHKLLLWQFDWASYQSGLQSLTLWTLLILALSVKTRRKLLFICSFSAVLWSPFGLLFCGALGLSISWFTPWGISSKLGIEEGFRRSSTKLPQSSRYIGFLHPCTTKIRPLFGFLHPQIGSNWT